MQTKQLGIYSMLIDGSDSPMLLFGRYAYFRLELFDNTIYVQKPGILYMVAALNPKLAFTESFPELQLP